MSGAGTWRLLLLVLCLFVFGGGPVCAAKETAGIAEKGFSDSLRLDEVQDVFDGLVQQDNGNVFSIKEYVTGIMEGEYEFSFREFFHCAASQLGAQFDGQKQTFLKILALGILSGIFINFAGTIGDRDLSETGFYVTFLLLFVTMSAGFAAVSEVAAQALENLLTFMKVLIPSFSLTLCLGSGTGTSVAYYETMLIAISLLEMSMLYVFFPGVQVYFMLNTINQLADNHFSKMAELVRSFLRFGIKVLFGVLIGYQGIQGMLLPVMDRVKNNAVLKTAKGLPGVGNSIGSVADTVLGSGMLIKSAVGVGGILCIVVLCFYPLLKLFVFQLLYRLGSALVQPVSDKRVAAALHTAAESGMLLMKFVFAGALMFLLSITIVVISTNLTI